MPTPGFEFHKRCIKPDGTKERIEVSKNNYYLKKYTPPKGKSYSAVQGPKQSHADFLKAIKNADPYTGFRKLF